MGSEPIRVAVLLDSPLLPAWQRGILAQLAASGSAQLVLAVFDASAGRRRRRLRDAAFRAYESLDRRVFSQPRDHAVPGDVSSLLERCARLEARPLRGETGYRLAPADVAAIREQAPDLILKLGFPPLEGEVLGAAPLGVWSFDHEERARLGIPPFFWEMARGCPVVETALRATTPRGTRILQRSFAASDGVSLHRGRNAALWKTSQFLARALRDAASGDAADHDGEGLGAPALRAPARAPNVLELARFAGSAALRVRRTRRLLGGTDWILALRPSSGSLAEGGQEGFTPIDPPPGRFHADPMLVEDSGRLWLFFEDAPRFINKGAIRCAEVLPSGVLGECRTVMECEYHLSYPFVWRWQGEFFMLPETSEHRTLELWRATDFPWRWRLEKVLLHDVVAVDPTLVEHDGRLWLFAGMSEAGASPHDELFLFHAVDLLGDWRAHPRNPVVSDVRRARPAGPFFEEDGRLFRPAQDCAERYGAAIWIHRVDALDERHYRETPVHRIDPSFCPGAIATHTLGRCGGFDVIDVRALQPDART